MCGGMKTAEKLWLLATKTCSRGAVPGGELGGGLPGGSHSSDSFSIRRHIM